MPRKVIIRRKEWDTDVYKLEQVIQKNWKQFDSEFREALEDTAEFIQEDAKVLVPVKTGKLKNSINVRVSRSHRYPGIIAQATAKRKGFDYALIQEENENYNHIEPAQAHYLGQPFYKHLTDLFNDFGIDIPIPTDNEYYITYDEEGQELIY